MNVEVGYVLDSAAWSLGGLVIGYLLGRTEREIRDIKRRLDARTKPKETEHDHA